MDKPLTLGEWRRQMETELIGNILPFWMANAVDPRHGGLVGALTNDLQVRAEVPRSSVVCARILWTFAAAFRRYRRPTYLKMAERAYGWLTTTFWDEERGGVYWQVNAAATPLDPRKHSYAQAFAIYGLAEYYLASDEGAALAKAQDLFALLERHAHDPTHGGYIEGCGRAWEAQDDMRLSAKEPQSRKSMNTLLHILEAYTTLLRAWNDPHVRTRLAELLDLFGDRLYSAEPFPRYRLFFDDAWQPLPDHVSYGHDIEASWLLVKAADALGDPAREDRARARALEIAAAVHAHGLAPDGSVVYARHADGSVDAAKHWWAQAEGVVGFVNAWQIRYDDQYLAAAQRIWEVIQAQFVDRTHGDWFKVLSPEGVPLADQYKVGPWECPYHHGRMCLELLARFRA